MKTKGNAPAPRTSPTLAAAAKLCDADHQGGKTAATAASPLGSAASSPPPSPAQQINPQSRTGPKRDIAEA